jgi:CheY-like chemotaxis protein
VLIALTGYGREEDERRAAAAGFDHHLVKPVDPDALQALLALARPVPEDRPERAAGREASG